MLVKYATFFFDFIFIIASQRNAWKKKTSRNSSKYVSGETLTNDAP